MLCEGSCRTGKALQDDVWDPDASERDGRRQPRNSRPDYHHPRVAVSRYCDGPNNGTRTVESPSPARVYRYQARTTQRAPCAWLGHAVTPAPTVMLLRRRKWALCPILLPKLLNSRIQVLADWERDMKGDAPRHRGGSVMNSATAPRIPLPRWHSLRGTALVPTRTLTRSPPPPTRREAPKCSRQASAALQRHSMSPGKKYFEPTLSSLYRWVRGASGLAQRHER